MSVETGSTSQLGVYDQILEFRRAQLIQKNTESTQKLRVRSEDNALRRKAYPEFLGFIVPILAYIAQKDPDISLLSDENKRITYSSKPITNYIHPQIVGGAILKWGVLDTSDTDIEQIYNYRVLNRKLKDPKTKRKEIRRLEIERDILGAQPVIMHDYKFIGVALGRFNPEDPFMVKVLGSDSFIPLDDIKPDFVVPALSQALEDPWRESLITSVQSLESEIMSRKLKT